MDHNGMVQFKLDKYLWVIGWWCRNEWNWFCSSQDSSTSSWSVLECLCRKNRDCICSSPTLFAREYNNIMRYKDRAHNCHYRY